jgi:hypothetical protein
VSVVELPRPQPGVSISIKVDPSDPSEILL